MKKIYGLDEMPLTLSENARKYVEESQIQIYTTDNGATYTVWIAMQETTECSTAQEVEEVIAEIMRNFPDGI